MHPKNSPFPGHSAPSAGFEVPLEMLAACHHRVESQCATLQRLVEHLATHGSDAQARVAAAAVLRYFDHSAADHHADEEVDLFPALIDATTGSDATCMRVLIESLERDHRILESQWQHLRPLLLRIAAGEPQALLTGDVMPMVDLYERHMQLEEAQLLPMAARLLSDSALDRVGLAMRTRRGVS
ncbi:MAG: hemerythrin domain-containing protein [Burkholderiaceae bacterium]